MNRHEISKKYLAHDQLGLEIAGLHNPWPMVHEGCKAIQMDLYTKEELYASYPEHKNDKLVTVQILDDGNYCRSIATDSMDFVLSSHVLEHCENTIEAIRNWLRVVKKGGYVCMAVPHKNNWIDKNREVTTLSHFLTEFRDPHLIEDVNREAHYYEYMRVVDGTQGKELDDRVRSALTAKPRHPHIHWHTFTEVSLRNLLILAKQDDKNQAGFDILEYHHVGHEMLVVLQKTVDGDLVWS